VAAGGCDIDVSTAYAADRKDAAAKIRGFDFDRCTPATQLLTEEFVGKTRMRCDRQDGSLHIKHSTVVPAQAGTHNP